MRRDGRVQVVFYTYQFGRKARTCRDSPHVCPTPTPIRPTDRITYFAPSLWFGIYYAVLVGRGIGQQITPRGLSLHAGCCSNWHLFHSIYIRILFYLH